MKKFLLCIVVNVMACLGNINSAWAKDWPTKPINLIVAYAPGGATDVLARIVAASFSQQLGSPVVVKNMPGANNMLALREMLSADQDHTFIMADSGFVSGPASLGNHDYTQFVPVSIFASSPAVLVRNIKVASGDFLQKSKLGQKISIATADLNLPASVWIMDLKPLEVVPIPYKGSGPALIDVVAGHVDYASNGLLSSWPFIVAKQVIPVMVSSERRTPSLPDVPTYLELGFRGKPQFNWWGILVNQKVSPQIRQSIHNMLTEAIKTNERLLELRSSGLDVLPVSMPESQRLYKVAMEAQKSK